MDACLPADTLCSSLGDLILFMLIQANANMMQTQLQKPQTFQKHPKLLSVLMHEGRVSFVHRSSQLIH